MAPGAVLAGKNDPAAAVVAADIAYDRATQRDGTWTATRAFAISQSEMFVPQRVKTLQYGANLPDPPGVSAYKVRHAWIACDGSIGVTTGSWKIKGRPDRGFYEIVWAQMRDGSYRILLQHAGPSPRNLPSRPGRKGMRAACGAKPPPLPISAPDAGVDFKLGSSRDQTLIWSSAVTQQGDVRIVISLWDGTRHVPVLEDMAPAPSAR